MSQNKAVVGAILMMLVCGCAPTGKEARTLADATSASSRQASPADAAAPSQEVAPAAAPAPSTTAPGMKVFIDPRTGLQRAPTAQEWADMVQRQQQQNAEKPPSPPAPPRKLNLPDGTQGYELGDTAMSSLRVCKGADGSTVVGHACPSTTGEKAP